MVMERLSSLKKRTKDNLLSLLKNDKNKIAAVIGAIIGASTQEDNGNELLTIPIGMAIGAITGAGLTFSSPVVIASSLPEEKSASYTLEKPKREESLRFKNLFSKADSLIEKINKGEEAIKSLSDRLSTTEDDKAKSKLSEKIAKNIARIDRYGERFNDIGIGISDSIRSTMTQMSESDLSKFHSMLSEHNIQIDEDPLEIISMEDSKGVMSAIREHSDSGFSKRIENMVAVNLESYKKFGNLSSGGYSPTFGTTVVKPISKANVQAKINKKTNTLVNHMSDDHFDELVSSILAQNNTPSEKVEGIKTAISKIRQHSLDNNQKMFISDNVVSTSVDGKQVSYPLVKYSDTSNARFIETNNGTRFVAKQFNPLGSLFVNEVPFNFQQTGRTTDTNPRIPTSIDITESYDPIEAVNFFGVNKSSSNAANSLTQYIAKEDIDRNYNDMKYSTRLGEVTGKQIELKHTVKPASISPTGEIVDKSIGEIIEVPKNGIQSEIKTIIDSLIRDNPERVLYGEDGTTRKTSIVRPDSYRQPLISPVPNAARGGQGVTNRGKNSEMRITKKLISGKNTIKAMPYLFGSYMSFGDGSILFDERTKMQMSENGKLEIAPNRNGEFDLSIFGSNKIEAGLAIANEKDRREYFNNINYEQHQKQSIYNITSQLAAKNDKQKASVGMRILDVMQSGKIGITQNETVGISPEGNQVRIPDYYTHANIVDAKINEKGNLSLVYEGFYNPTVGGDVKILSQSAKSAGLKIAGTESDIISGLDFLESENLIDYKFSEKGVLQYITFDKDKILSDSSIMLSLPSLKQVELEKQKSIDGKIIVPASVGTDHPMLKIAESIGESIRKNSDYDIIVPISESSIGDIYDIKNMNVEDVIRNKGGSEYNSLDKYFKNYGVNNFDEYKHESEEYSLGSRIENYDTDYKNGVRNSKLTPHEFAKRELATEMIYQMYTSENKAAPDIHEMIRDGQSLIHDAEGRYIPESVQDIVDKRLLVSDDKDTRIAASKKVRGIIRAIIDQRDENVIKNDYILRTMTTNPLAGAMRRNNNPDTIENFFSKSGKLLNPKSVVAIEEGLEIHGVGNQSRFSWIGLYQMLENKIDKDTLKTIADYDSEALHEIEMIRGDASVATKNQINTADLNKKQILQINNALNSDSEFRHDNIMSILPDTNINPDDGIIRFNLSDNAGELRSVGFSTFKTGRSGTLRLEDKEFLVDMDKAKLGIVSADIQLSAEHEGTELYKLAKENLDKSIVDYKKLVSQALKSDGSSNILKRANSMIAKNSEIRAAKPVGGYVADVIVPRLREQSGVRGSYSVYDMDAYNEIMEKFGFNPDEHFLEEVSDKEDFKVDFENDKSTYNRENVVYRVMRKYEDGTSMPVYDMVTREPAFGPQSTMIKEILVTNDKSILPEGKRSHIIGIPQTEEKTVEAIYQKQDFDQDTLGSSFISLENKDDHENIRKIKYELDKRVSEDFDFQKKLDIKSKNKRMISVQAMLDIHEKTGIPISQVWTMEETALAQKGTLRKTATPFVASLGISIRDSITAGRISGAISEDQAFTARSLMYTIEENILKTQHEETAKAVAPVPEIFKLIESRKNFLRNNITEKDYRRQLENTIQHYVHLDTTDQNELLKFNSGVSALIDSDITYARRLNGVSKTVLSISSNLSDRAIESNTFFTDLSQALTDVMFNRIGGKTIFEDNGSKINIPPEQVGVNAEENIGESISKKLLNVKNVVNEISSGKNLKRLGIGTLALAGTTIVLGRESAMPSTLDMGQDAEKQIGIPNLQTQESGYITQNKISKSPSVKISKMQNGIPKEKINRLIYGNSITTNRVRDERK